MKRLLADERGAQLTEYTVITGFVALVSIPALISVGYAVAVSFAHIRQYALFPFP